jgi:hypothetical protein
MKKLLLIFAVMLLLPATAGAATLNATPSTFASVFSQAQGGDTILLSSGSYGSWNGGAKTSTVTIVPASGASATFSGGTFGSSVRNITIKGVTYTGPIGVYPGSTKLNLVFDGITMGAVGPEGHEGRMSIIGGGSSVVGGNGVQVKNSTFGPGGCSDGIQDSSNGTEVGPGNEFKGITQGSCSEHVDAIQPYASNYIWIHDNYFHDNEQGIMSPDGVSTGYLIENNVIHTSTGYPCMHLGDTRNGTVRHNVCRNGGIRVYGGNQNVASQNMKVQNNISTGNDISACTGCTVDHNLTISQVTFTGGSGRCQYATASPKGTASDGTDIGLNDCAGSPPPPPPPTDHTPVARFTASPEPSAPKQTVTFDATASTCEDTPCTYHWHDINNGDWPLGPDGVISTIAFQSLHDADNGGPVQAQLVLTDADGDVATVTHNHYVTTTTPPSDTTPPDTTITSFPPNSTSDSVTWSFTSNEPGSTFQCKVNGSSWFTCSSPYSRTGQGQGTYTYSFRAIDPAGNVDPTPATGTWTRLS